MTWTKLGQEFPENARKLSDAAFRLHVEALCWANRYGTDLNIEADDLGHMSYTKEPKAAAAELVAAKWRTTIREGWFIGEHRPEWQLEASVVEKRRQANAERQNHSMCTSRCTERRNVTDGVTETRNETRDPERSGLGNGSDAEVRRRIPFMTEDERDMYEEAMSRDQVESERRLAERGDAA